jgi:hypothetical protein
MKNNILKVFVLFVFFCAITPAFALPPTGPGSTGEYEYNDGTGYAVEDSTDGEEAAAGNPIDSKMYLLAGAGILVAGYFFNRNKLVKA